MDIQLSQYHLIKRLIFLHLIVWAPLLTNQLIINVRVYFWTFNPVLLIYVSIPMSTPQHLNYYSFVVSFKIKRYRTSLAVQSLRTYLATQGMLVQPLVRELRSHMLRGD